MTVKEQLHKIVDDLADENPVEEMEYRLYVLRKLQKGLDSIDQARGIELAAIIHGARDLLESISDRNI